jgi:palmitoyltransferase
MEPIMKYILSLYTTTRNLTNAYVHGQEWPHHVPQVAFLLIYILAGVIGLALVFMAGWHVWSVSTGETSVESQDHEVYRRMAKGRGEVRLFDFSLRTGV